MRAQRGLIIHVDLMKSVSTAAIFILAICSGLDAEKPADPKGNPRESAWEEIVDRCDFGASYEAIDDGSLQVNLAKSNCEDVFRFSFTHANSLSTAILLVRYYAINDDSVDRGSTARVEVYRINFHSDSGKWLSRLGEDGEWIVAADKDKIAERARAVFMAAESHSKSKGGK